MPAVSQSQRDPEGDHLCFGEPALPINGFNGASSPWRGEVRARAHRENSHVTAAQLINSINFNQDLLGYFTAAVSAGKAGRHCLPQPSLKQ